MILVTVGTTMPFPSLLHEVDALAARGTFGGQRILCQTGKTEVALNHCETFAFSPSLDDFIQQADLVITHGGSTVFSLIKARQKFIAFPNPMGADQHQHTLLSKLQTIFPVLWSENVDDLAGLYERAMTRDLPTIQLPSLADQIVDYVLS